MVNIGTPPQVRVTSIALTTIASPVHTTLFRRKPGLISGIDILLFKPVAISND
jgi:hypothetical protein